MERPPPDTHLLHVVALERGAVPPRGWIEGPSGTRRPFNGLLEFVALFEEALDLVGSEGSEIPTSER